MGDNEQIGSKIDLSKRITEKVIRFFCACFCGIGIFIYFLDVFKIVKKDKERKAKEARKKLRTMFLKGVPKIKIKTVAIIIVIEIILLPLAAFLSLGDSSEPNHKYAIDIYAEIFRVPLGYFFQKNSLLFISIDWVLDAIVIERVITILTYLMYKD